MTDTAAPLHTLFEVAHTLYRARAYGYFDHNIAVGDGLVASLAAVDKGDLSSHQNVFVTATRRIISSANSVMRDIQVCACVLLRDDADTVLL